MADVFTDLAGEADVVDRLAAGYGTRLTTGVAHRIAALAAYFCAVRHCAGNSGGPAAPAPAEFLTDVARLPARWREEHRAAVAALAAAPADRELAWFGGPVRPSVLAAEALTELFAHGQDLADGLGVRPDRDDGIGHVAYYGVRTRDRGYTECGLTPPAGPFRFELVAPSGTLWAFGPADAADRVSGPAEDFCLLVTRRRARHEVRLTATGAHAGNWLGLACALRPTTVEGSAGRRARRAA
jgi:uncharacterized protein (TIGR03084 family)